MPRSLSRLSAKLEKPQDNSFLERIDVIDFLESLEIANINQIKPGTIQFSCPFPGHSNGDEHPSAVMSTTADNPKWNTRFICYGCGARGDAITFLSDFEGISRTKARRLLQEYYARNYKKPRGGIQAEFERRLEFQQRQRSKQGLVKLDWSQYEQFDVDWDYYGDPANGYREYADVNYFYSRGFTTENLRNWRFGYDAHSNRLTIPVCDEKGNLVGVKGRAWRPGHQPRYLILGDKPGYPERYGFTTYEKSLVVYGLDTKFDDCDYHVFLEGELNTKSMHAMGIQAFCTGGATMSDAQLEIIRDNCEMVIFWFDDDTAGINGLWGRPWNDGSRHGGIIERVEKYMPVKVMEPARHDANDYLAAGLIDKVIELVQTAKPSYLASPKVVC